MRIDIANKVVIPKFIFSVRSSAVDAGVKKPVIATNVIIEVGRIKLIT